MDHARQEKSISKETGDGFSEGHGANEPLNSTERYKFMSNLKKTAGNISFENSSIRKINNLFYCRLSSNIQSPEENLMRKNENIYLKRFSRGLDRTNSIFGGNQKNSMLRKPTKDILFRVKPVFACLQKPNPIQKEDKESKIELSYISEPKEEEFEEIQEELEDNEIEQKQHTLNKSESFKSIRNRLRKEKTNSFIPKFHFDPSVRTLKTIQQTYHSNTSLTSRSSTIGKPGSRRNYRIDTNIDINSELMKNSHFVEYLKERQIKVNLIQTGKKDQKDQQKVEVKERGEMERINSRKLSINPSDSHTSHECPENRNFPKFTHQSSSSDLRIKFIKQKIGSKNETFGSSSSNFQKSLFALGQAVKSKDGLRTVKKKESNLMKTEMIKKELMEKKGTVSLIKFEFMDCEEDQYMSLVEEEQLDSRSYIKDSKLEGK